MAGESEINDFDFLDRVIGPETEGAIADDDDLNGSPKRIPAGNWKLDDDLWTNDVIRISLPGERFSVLPILPWRLSSAGRRTN